MQEKQVSAIAGIVVLQKGRCKEQLLIPHIKKGENMDNMQKKQPTSITVIGWSFILSAALMIFSGVMGLAIANFMKQTTGEIPGMSQELPATLRIMDSFFQNFQFIALLQIAVSIFVLIAGIQFLKLRKWARNGLEVISWVGLILTVAFGIIWVISWVSMSSKIPIQESASVQPPMFGVFGAVMGGVVTLFWAAPIIVIIYFLRGKVIKGAVS